MLEGRPAPLVADPEVPGDAKVTRVDSGAEVIGVDIDRIGD